MSDEDKQGNVGMRRSLKILLAVSLGLNMLVIGAVGGMMYHGGPTGGAIGARAASFGPFTRALSHQDRRQIGQAMRDELGGFRENLPKVRAGFTALKEALSADVYDSVLVHRLVKQQQAAGLKRYQVGQRLLLERLDEMSQKERQTFAERLGRRHR
ncbi:periplasmic heavy metal sensor [Profundibacter sp.]